MMLEEKTAGAASRDAKVGGEVTSELEGEEGQLGVKGSKRKKNKAYVLRVIVLCSLTAASPAPCPSAISTSPASNAKTSTSPRVPEGSSSPALSLALRSILSSFGEFVPAPAESDSTAGSSARPATVGRLDGVGSPKAVRGAGASGGLTMGIASAEATGARSATVAGAVCIDAICWSLELELGREASQTKVAGVRCRRERGREAERAPVLL